MHGSRPRRWTPVSFLVIVAAVGLPFTARSHALCPIVVATLLGACAFAPLDLSALSCPCADGYRCDEATNRCVLGTLDAGARDAGALDAGRRDASVDAPTAADAPVDVPAVDAGLDAFVGLDAPLVSDAPDANVPDAGPVVGDRCSDPIELDLSSGRATMSVDLDDYADDYRSTFCGGATGRDLVFVVRLADPATTDLDIRVTDGTIDTVLGVGASCDETSEFGGAFDCEDDSVQDTISNPRFVLHPALWSDVYIFLDGNTSAASGVVSIEVLATPRAVDACGPGAIDLTGGGKIAAQALGDHAPFGTCAAAAAFLPTDAIVSVRAPADGEIGYAGAYTFDRPSSISLHTGCGSADEVACATSANPELFAVPVTPGQVYYLVVHGFGAPGGDRERYALEYEP